MFEIVIKDRYEPRRIGNFNKFTLGLTFDSIADTFGFAWLFDEKNYDHKELLCLSHFHPIEVYYNGEKIITGNLINNEFEHNPDPSMIQIGGYSRPGILSNSCVSVSDYPLQTKGLTIEKVAKKLCTPKHITVKIDDSVLSKMKQVVTDDDIQPTDTIESYLKKITEVKRIVMTHNTDGELVFTEAKTNVNPVRIFDNTTGSFPATGFKMKFNGEGMHRFITVTQQATGSGTKGGQYTIRNPFVINTYPKDITITSSSGNSDDMKSAARQELAKELQNITLSVEVYDWKLGDELIKPGQMITVYDEKLYLYLKVDWFIKSVSYNADEKGVTCSLSCVLPEVFNEDEVLNIFKDINIHGQINEY